jgi:FixJ family two-component response regulator
VIGVVDDDESVRDAMSSLIRSVGYRCRLFSSAEEFLKSGRLCDTDCVVLDVRMPGLSGLELQRILRRHGCSTPVIFVTGYVDEKLQRKAMEDGAAAFFCQAV